MGHIELDGDGPGLDDGPIFIIKFNFKNSKSLLFLELK